MDAPDTPQFRALMRLIEILEPFKQDLVLVGGWAPFLLLQRYGKPGWEHAGSLDVDFMLDASRTSPETRDGIRAALTAAGARRLLNRDFSVYFEDSYVLPVEYEQGRAPIQVDLMGMDEVIDELSGWRSRTALALRNSEQHELVLAGRTLSVRMVSAAALVCLKAIAMTERSKPKDAYDVYTLLAYYKTGPADLAAELAPIIGSGPPAKMALRSLRKRFRTAISDGPQMIAEFLAGQIGDEEQNSLRQKVHDTFQVLFSELERLTPAE
jgi:hypothetical protein